MSEDGQDRSGMDEDGQWPEWLSATEAEVYSLQVHGHKIKEKTWRRQTHKDPPPVKWQEENIPHGTRYVFYRSDVDRYVADRKKEAENAIARSRRTSLRGGNRGPGWTGWCGRLWGFDGLAFGVDGGEVGAISVIWPLGASTRWLFAGLAVAFEGNGRAPWGPWRGIEQSGAVAGGKDGVF